MADLKELLAESDARIDAIVLDPRTAAKQGRTIVVTQALKGIPADIAAEIARPLLREYDDQIRAGFENGNYGVRHQALSDLQTKLRNGVRNERENGKLKPITPSGEIERSLHALRGIGFRGIEFDSLKATLKDGERILEVGVRSIRTSTRTIGRCELIDVLKPSTQTSVSAWNNQFPSENELAERESAAHRAANPIPPSFDNYDHNRPRPMKMD